MIQAYIYFLDCNNIFRNSSLDFAGAVDPFLADPFWLEVDAEEELEAEEEEVEAEAVFTVRGINVNWVRPRPRGAEAAAAADESEDAPPERQSKAS